MKRLSLIIGLIYFVCAPSSHARPNELTREEESAGWSLLFDGRTLDGWHASEEPGTFTVKDGALVVRGPRSHLYYVGDGGDHDFVNFELSLDVLTFPQANSGVYFHTTFQENGWPDHGHEVQVNNSHRDPSRTAGLYDIKPNRDAVARDGTWFTLNIRVEGRHVVTRVNGRVVADYTEPADWKAPSNHVGRRIAHGTFAIQGHDPESEVHYRNIKVKRLPGESAVLPLLRVSDNKRFLVKADGTPFFWLGDTAWELFHRLNREEAEHYLRMRAAQGYNVVQAVALAETNGLIDPNPYGHVPLQELDPTRPQEEYFRHVDWVIDRAASFGLYVALLPTWGDKWNNRKSNGEKWGAGPQIFNPDNALVYGEWLGRRYAGRTNIVWVVGGDRFANEPEHQATIRAMAKGLRQGDGGRHLITFHPTGGLSSSQHFHDDDWLAFNMRQNGHQIEYSPRYAKTREDYDRRPTKPVIDGEPAYEDHPIDFKASALGHTTASDIRRLLYWNVFSGAFGHTYGHHSVWQMFAPGRKPINAPLMSWREALLQPGATQMQHGRRLMESRPFLTRVPADTLIVPGEYLSAMPGEGRGRFVATKDSNGRYAMIYVPIGGRPFKVNLSEISGGTVRAWWFNPRDGSATKMGEYPNTGVRQFASPTPGDDSDWVLVLDDAAQNFQPPGVGAVKS